MIYFPKISPPSYPFEEKLEDNSLRSQFEDGSVQSRRKFTRSRDSFSVTWENISGEEYAILKNFIKNTVHFSALEFAWEYPKFNTRNNVWNDSNNSVGDELKIVRITNVESAKCSNLDYWTVRLELTEV